MNLEIKLVLQTMQSGFIFYIKLILTTGLIMAMPAILFEIEKRGYVKEGFYADLVLVDLNKKTFVTEESLLYKCKWSPFEGETFEAKIDTTWVNIE